MNQYSFPFLNIVMQNTTRECRVSGPAKFGIVLALAPAPEIRKRLAMAPGIFFKWLWLLLKVIIRSNEKII